MKKIINIQYTSNTHSLFLYEDILENLNLNYFIKKIDENISDKLSYNTNVKNQMTDFLSFIHDIEIHQILKRYVNLFNVYLNLGPMKLEDCWGTKSCEFVETTRHDHGLGVSGILFLTEGGPGTFFPQFNLNIDEKIGKIVFFDSRALHEVKKTKITNPRYLLSFNFKRINFWELPNEKQ